MDLRFASPSMPAASRLLCIHATGAWTYAGGEDDEDNWPVVAAFEV
ncbi:MAG: hypothetical protein ABR562_09295 [Thermoplasmatota archaeon]